MKIMIVDNVVLRPPRLPLARGLKSHHHIIVLVAQRCDGGVSSPQFQSERRRCSCKRDDQTHDIGMSTRTLAKSVMMMQRRSKQIRSAEAKQKHSAVSIGGEMARGSRHAVVAAAYLLLCENEHRQALETKSERNALVRSAGERRRSSRAAMWAGGDGWMAARRFSHFGQEPMNRRRGRGVSGVFGGGPSIFPD